MRFLLLILITTPAIAQEITVPAKNPEHSIVQIQTNGEGALTVVDKEGNSHQTFKCGDTYLFTGPPNEYLAQLTRFSGEWSVVYEPFSIGGNVPSPPPPPAPTPSYRESIQRVIPESSTFDKTLLYVGFKVGLEKLDAWGGESIQKQVPIVVEQAQRTSSPNEWINFITVWSQETQKLPQDKWKEAWTITTDLLSNKPNTTKSTSSTD